MIFKLTKPVVLVLVMVVCTAQISWAQSAKENPITTAVPFLRLAADARAAGMGDVSIATSPDANSMFYNGSKTVFNTEKYGVGLTYTPWLSELDLKSIYQLSLSAFYKLDETQSISFGLRNFSQGSFVLTDNVGQEIKTIKPNDIAVEAGYSRKLSSKMSVGIGLRYITSRLGDNSTNADYKSGSAVAGDVSLFYMGPKGLNFGLALTNLGSKINYGGKANFIPANLGLGTSYTKDINSDNKLTFALDVNKLLVPTPPDASNSEKVEAYENKSVISSWFSSFGDAPNGGNEELKEFQLGLGAEYMYKEMFSVRAGYFTENELKGNRNYLTVGVGFKYNIAGLNFSYLAPTGQNANMNALKNTLRISLLFDFNNAESTNK